MGLFTPLAPLSDSPANPALPSPPQAHTGSGSSNGTSNEKPKTPSDAARAPLPPPILKKARADSDDPPKTTRIVVPDPDTASPNRPTQSEKNAPNQGRKKTVFVATGANSKRRPLLSRRKSSRSPSSNTPSAKQSPAPTPLEGTSPAEEGPMNPQRSNLSSGKLFEVSDIMREGVERLHIYVVNRKAAPFFALISIYHFALLSPANIFIQQLQYLPIIPARVDHGKIHTLSSQTHSRPT